MSDRSVSQRDHWRLLGMLLLGLVAALTIHGDLCGPVHEAGHHPVLDGYAIDQNDGHGHGDTYHCRVDHEYSPSAVAERPARTPRHTHANTGWPHDAGSASNASAADVGQPVLSSQRRPAQRFGRDVLATVCVSRT